MNIFSIDSWDQPRSEVNDSILRCTHGSVSLGLPHIIAFVNQSLSFQLLAPVASQRKAMDPHRDFPPPRSHDHEGGLLMFCRRWLVLWYGMVCYPYGRHGVLWRKGCCSDEMPHSLCGRRGVRKKSRRTGVW